MISDFYQRHSAALLLYCLAALPVLTFLGEQIPCNNDIETWLPRNSQIRADYDRFCQTFGADESILIAFRRPFPQPDRLEALCGRLSGLEGVGSCLSRCMVVDAMKANGVSDQTARKRLVHLLSTPDDELETVLVSINQHGIRHRSETVYAIRHQLEYCGFENAILGGGPLVATRLDELGSRRRASVLFGLTLLTCFLLLRWNIGCWKTSAAIMLVNIFCIELTLTTIRAVGMEMNFIMSSLPVMVMVFTTAAVVHFIGHYRRHAGQADAVGQALAGVIRPAMFAAITTILGLVSLAISDVGPIPMFGAGAAWGTFYSFLAGTLITPAILVAVGYKAPPETTTGFFLNRWGIRVVNRPLQILIPGVLITAICCAGLPQLRSLIDPLEFLPSQDPVVQDTLTVSRLLTSPTSVEAVVDFGSTNSSFVERLREIRRIEQILSAHPNVRHTLSVADFFADELSERTLSLSALSVAAGSSRGVSGMLADGNRLWRISLRLQSDSPSAVRHTISGLTTSCKGLPITFTGIGPLLEFAQGQIFEGFWKSFASAFLLITVVMICALRSISAGLIAMIPNLTPIALVFGILGWLDRPIDIGIMMTASIALGLAVDGTFHFLFSYRDCRISTGCRYRAVRRAILQTGGPIISSALICGTGLLALGLSPFRPTMRFGLLMFFLMTTALAGDLLLLPAFLALGSRRKRLLLRKSKPSANGSSRAAA